MFCPESKEASATQNPQRKSLRGVVARSEGQTAGSSTKEPKAADLHPPIPVKSEPVPAGTDDAPISEIIRSGESSTVEFKSSLRVNLHTGNQDSRIEHAVLKTLAAFLNTRGGTLVIGVDDKGVPLGLENDGFQTEDKMDQHLANLIRDRLGAHHGLCLHSCFVDYEGKRLLVVRCDLARTPAYLKDGKAEYFYVRTSGTTTELPASQIHDYLKQRFAS